MNPFMDEIGGDDEYQRRLRAQTMAQLKPEDIEPLYQQHLGRPSDPGGLAAHLQNPFGLAGVEATIKGSPEFAQRQAGGPASTTPTPQPEPGAAGAGGAQTGWAFNSPTGGRKEFSYTPKDYGSDMSGFQGFSPMGAGSSDQSSIKNIFRNTAAGLAGDGFTEADVDEVVRRLIDQGIPVTKVDPYQIDFGTGEGPIQVRHSSDQAWWNNRATEGGGVPPATASAPVSAGGTGPSAGTGGDSLSQIQALINELLKNGYSRDALMAQLQG